LFNATDPPCDFEKYSKYLVDDHDRDTSNEEKFLSQSVKMYDLVMDVTYVLALHFSLKTLRNIL